MCAQPQPSNFDQKLSAIIGLTLGLLFLVGGFWVRHIEAQEHATLVETQGTIVDHASRRKRDATNDKEQITYAPVIEFLTNGDRTRFTGKYESFRSGNGNKVVVRYNPQQPATTARVVDPLESLTAWGMFGMGGLAIIFSLGELLPLRTWFSRRQP